MGRKEDGEEGDKDEKEVKEDGREEQNGGKTRGQQ